MSHGIQPGQYRVPLVGGVQEHEKREGYFSRLLSWRDVRRRLRGQVSPGRPVGKPEGTWVTDLAELHQHVLLCWACAPKFDAVHKRYGYFKDNRWKVISGGVNGACDGCRAEGRDPRRGMLQLFVHESRVGHSYMPL